MLITRDNYEVYFIDYIDGNLKPDEVEVLMLFLEQNPDLAAELDGLHDIVLETSQVQFEHKSTLKKNLFERNGIANEFDYLCIAEMENDISVGEKKKLDSIIAENPSLESQKSVYAKAKLIPDETTVFTHKASLRRAPVFHIRQSNLRNAMGVAAGMALLFGLFTVFTNLDNTVNEMVASTEPITKEIEKEISGHQVASVVGKETVQNNSNQLATTGKVFTSTPDVEDNQELFKEETTLDESVDIQEIRRIEIKPLELRKEQNLLASAPRIEPVLPTITAETEQLADNTKPQPQGSSRTLGLFDIVQLGVEKFSNATGSSMQLSAEKDPNGKLTKIRFDSNLFALSTPVRKK